MNPTIVVITYNRLNSLKRLLKSLELANYYGDKVNLIISIDKGNNEEIISYCDSYFWPHGKKIISKNTVNLGLRKHILKCGDYTTEYGDIIMLEDDLIVSKYFYKYTKEAIAYYNEDSRIGGISLYNYELNEFANNTKFMPMDDGSDIFFANVPSSWGQAWTPKQWRDFKDWYQSEQYLNKNYETLIPNTVLNWKESSWKKYFHMYLAEKNKYFIYPRVSLSSNMCEIGTHNKKCETSYQVKLVSEFDRKYIFKDLDKSISIYDSFLENKLINNYLDIKLDGNLEVDFYGTRRNNKARYLLTTKIMDYKVLKSWALRLKPYEMNLIYDIEGEEVFLYDLSISYKNKINKFNNKIAFIKYNNPNINRRGALFLSVHNILRKVKGDKF